jgi:hypothetical protein
VTGGGGEWRCISGYISVFRNGKEWCRIRSELQKGFSEIKHVRSHLDLVNQVMDEFIELRIGQRATFQDFLPELSRLYLESKQYSNIPTKSLPQVRIEAWLFCLYT